MSRSVGSWWVAIGISACIAAAPPTDHSPSNDGAKHVLSVTSPRSGTTHGLAAPILVIGEAVGATDVVVTMGSVGVDAGVRYDGTFSALLTRWVGTTLSVRASWSDGHHAVLEVPVVPNQAPVMGDLEVSPTKPTSGIPLTAIWATAPVDPELEPVFVQWQWLRNDVVVPGATSDTVAGALVQGGDTWTVHATVSDPWQQVGPSVAHTTIVDTAPTGLVVMSPDPPRAGQPVDCYAVDVHDIDGDVVTPQATWSVEGQVLGVGGRLESAPAFASVSCTLVLRTPNGDSAPMTVSSVVVPDLPPMNIVVVVLDDIGAYDVGAYGIGADAPSTPTMDSLAREGATFVRAWSHPVCSPTRASIMTGRYPFRTGVGDVLERWRPDSGLPLDEVTIADWLLDRAAGYDTAATGKWHLSGEADPQGPTPSWYGFNTYVGTPDNLVPSDNLPDAFVGDYFRWESWIDGTPQVQSGYLTVREVDDALDRIAELQSPWLLYVGIHAAHLPLHVPPGAQRPRGGWTGRERYKAMIEALDTELERLLVGLPTDTTIILLADNGSPSQVGAPPPYTTDELKGSPMEGGIRVPLIIRSPYVRTPGVRIRTLASVVDLFPTIADIARAPVDGSLDLDGRSLIPFLADPTRVDTRAVVYSERFQPSGDVAAATLWERAIRDTRFKVIRGLQTSDRCFELSDDFREGEDLYGLPSRTAEQQAGCDTLATRLDTQDVR